MNTLDPKQSEPGERDAFVNEIAGWLMTEALSSMPLEELFEGCSAQLMAAGIPVERAHVTFQTLHPLYSGIGLTWTLHSGLQKRTFDHRRSDDEIPESWTQSPLYFLAENDLPFLRRRLAGDEAMIDFPLLQDLQAEGATDYIAYTIRFGDGHHDGIAGSWSTSREGGFTNRDIASLQRIQKRFAVACKMRIREQIAVNVVKTYLGNNAGLRVLDGQIVRGDGETISAAFWYSDLRGSTRLAEALPPEEFIQLLNSYYEVSAGAVIAAGGEILSFIGDAVLAAFPVTSSGDDAPAACRRALSAYNESRSNLKDLNAVRRNSNQGELRFGTALHLGKAVFGNIGIPERLAFTVVGTTINEVARLQSLTKSLGSEGVASGNFVNQTGLELPSLGLHELRGIEGQTEVFAIPE